MKLARKLTLVLVAVMLTVLAIRVMVRVRYEAITAEETTRAHQRSVGRALRAAFVEVWRTQGHEGAVRMLRHADEENRRDLRWVSLEPDGPSSRRPRSPETALAALASGREESIVDKDAAGNAWLTTYVPFGAASGIPGAIELFESLSESEALARERLLEAIATTVTMTLLSILALTVAGLLLVGRPMRRLVEKARRIGAGDLSGPLAVRQNDEIGELAHEMNQMCDRLSEAQRRIEEETVARITAIEQLRHADRLSTVGKLASGIAHELGTPLNVVAGRAKMIVTGEARADEATECARIIGEQAERMTRIIRQLLDFARRRGPQTASCDLRELGRKTCALLHPLAQKARGPIELVSMGADEPVRVAVDADQIQQALANLVLNGIQAMPQGGRLTVDVGRAQVRPPADHGGPAGEYARVDVTDQGTGIPPEQVPRVFEPFFTTKGVGEGTGLGLSVAYGIVRDHGGWIEIDSELGRGSRFSIYLPLERGEVTRA